jgi:hypothetical protein
MRSPAAVAVLLLGLSSAGAVRGDNMTPAAPPATATPAAQTPLTPRGSCDAASLAWLIGKPKSEIPVPVDTSRRRVYCDACPVSQDYRPDRTDILFDANTGIVTEVKCG